MKERNFDEFLGAVYESAEEKSKKMIREIDEAGRAALASYTNEVRRASDERRRREDARIAAAGAAETSRRGSAIRRTLTSRRDEIEHEVFSEVQERVAVYTKTPEYTADLLRDAAALADALAGHSGARIAVGAADMEKASALSDAAGGLAVECDRTIALGGLRGKSDDIECDMTLDTKLSAARDKFKRESGLTVV